MLQQPIYRYLRDRPRLEAARQFVIRHLFLLSLLIQVREHDCKLTERERVQVLGFVLVEVMTSDLFETTPTVGFGDSDELQRTVSFQAHGARALMCLIQVVHAFVMAVISLRLLHKGESICHAHVVE